MKDEYVIINKTAIQKRIEELEEELPNFQRNQLAGTLACDALIKELKKILSKSTPLIPVLEDAYFEGECYGIGADACTTKQEYISNLKLDI